MKFLGGDTLVLIREFSSLQEALCGMFGVVHAPSVRATKWATAFRCEQSENRNCWKRYKTRHRPAKRERKLPAFPHVPFKFPQNFLKFQRRRNDDKNNFWEVESKGGVGREVGKEVNREPNLKFYCRPKAQEKKTAFWKVAFLLSSVFPRKSSDNNFGQLPPFPPSRGRTRRP